jgi:hypothetical protein
MYPTWQSINIVNNYIESGGRMRKKRHLYLPPGPLSPAAAVFGSGFNSLLLLKRAFDLVFPSWWWSCC